MRVLIVDDSKLMRKRVHHMVRHFLESSGKDGIEVFEAANGVEALESYHRDKPDLILSDWNMPEMDGMGLLQAIRGLDPDLPFGIITAQSTSALRECARYYGAHFLISKPFTAEALGAAMQSVIPD